MIATYAWLAGGEIPSQRLRSYTFGFAAAIGFFAAWLTTFTAPYFINPDALNWGPKYGYIWFPSGIVAAVWVWFFLPELKGRTLEEIDEMVCRPCFSVTPESPVAHRAANIGPGCLFTNMSQSSSPSCLRGSLVVTSASGGRRREARRRVWRSRCKSQRKQTRRPRLHEAKGGGGGPVGVGQNNGCSRLIIIRL